VPDGSRTTPDIPPDLERRSLEQLLGRLPDPNRIPRADAELSFAEPWEIRSLSMVVNLHEQGRFEWQDFQTELATAIAEWKATPADERPEWSYYACWQQAAERLLIKRALLTDRELGERTGEFLSGKRTPPHTHGGGLLTRDPGRR
jgi:nitrile hydratase accessory protein